MKFLKLLFVIISVSKCLGYLPEQDMDVPELAAHYGYQIETITTETKDGYFLVLHRIPFGKNRNFLRVKIVLNRIFQLLMNLPDLVQ